MEKFLASVSLALGLFTASAQAYSLDCKIDEYGQSDFVMDAHFAYIGEASFNCHDKRGNYYRIDLDGYGPGLAIERYDRLEFTCPLVTLKKMNRILDENKDGINLGGVRVQAGVFVAENSALYFGKGGGACSLLGVALGGGASVAYSALHLTRSGPPAPKPADTDENYYGY